MVSQIVDTVLTLAFGTILGIVLTYFVGGWFENRRKRKKVLKSLRLYLKSQYKLLYEHRRNKVSIDTVILDKFFVAGDLSLLSEEFQQYFNHYYNLIQSFNKKYLSDSDPTRELPEEYYRDLNQVNYSLSDVVDLELKPFYIKWKRRLEDWRKRRKQSKW